jgi:excisionase family DNA binding protein
MWWTLTHMHRKALTPQYDDPDDDLILESINVAAARLGCGRSSLYELIARGELRSVHIGRRHLIPRSERLRFVREQLARHDNENRPPK